MRAQAKWWTAAVTLCALASTAPAVGIESEQHEVDAESRLQNLRARIANLEAAVVDDDWLEEQRTAELRALVTDVLADADSRIALQDSSVNAGWDRGFFIASSDGSFRLRIAGMVQARYVLSTQDGAAPVDSTRSGFEMSRVRLGLIGHVFDPSWRYLFWAAWLSDGQPVYLDAWLEKKVNESLSFRVGQFKRPLWKEWLVPETRQQMIERSLLNARYSGIAVHGVMAIYQGQRVCLHAAFTDGGRTWNTPFSMPPSEYSGTLPWQLANEYAFSGRIEWLLYGNWPDATDFESWIGAEPMLVLGGAAHYQVGEYGTDDPESKLFQWTADANMKFGSANLFASVIGTTLDSGDGGRTRNEWGVLLQGGLFLNEDWEVVGRYEWGDLDGAGTVSDDLSILTIGVNRFWNRHGLKWMTDVGYAFKGVDAQWTGTGAGWRPDGPGGDGQIVCRTQMQLLF